MPNLAQPSSFNPNGFDLSPSAIKHFKQNLSNKNSSIGIRFSVSESSGCSGYTYSLDYVKSKNLDDLSFEFNDVSVFIDSESFLYLKGTKVDFEQDGVNEGIKFYNPNVKAVCGCGESFEVKI
jgi:iron-sulfur cluster assembly protein